MIVLPPGNILQNLYIKERVRKNKPKNFLEIGSGNGHISNILLKFGIKGVGYDLNLSACDNNSILNKKYINSGIYEVINDDFLNLITETKYDLIISSMVIEHLPEDILKPFINKCKDLLSEGGTITFLVPSSMKHWGIEDEIAGHIKRYEREDFISFKEKYNLDVKNISGLTYPISNWLFHISNYLVKKEESSKLLLSQKEKTVYTGNRNVSYKTTFPLIFGAILNEVVLYPFHILQKIFANNKNCLVIYCELRFEK